MRHAISSDGTPIAWWHSGGSGLPLLLVHGTAADHTRWDRVAPVLGQHFSVYAMDRRGRGGSGDAATYDIAREAEDVAAVIEQIGEPVHLLGHSFGAICCLEASRLTSIVRRLILYEPPVPVGVEAVPPGLVDRMEALIRREEFEPALLLFFREVVRAPAANLEILRSSPVWQARIALAPTIPRELRLDGYYRFDAANFATMRTPTLMLRGGDSPTFLSRAAEVVHDALPNSQIRIMPGQQHVAMDSARELFTREVVSFLTG